MYICKLCGFVFEAPAMSRESVEYDEGKSFRWKVPVCPDCRGGDIEEAVSCPSCDGYKSRGEHICASCRENLAKRFKDLTDSLCPEALEQLDDWLDGASVTWSSNFV